MAFEWLSLAASGITLLYAGRDLRSHISGFSLAHKVDAVAKSIDLLSGQMVKIQGDITRVADGHYATNTLGVSLRGASVVDLRKSRRIRKPTAIPMDYVTECETEIDPGFSQAFLDTPENFLHGICDLTEDAPDHALLKDDTLVPWHFADGDAHKIGFTKKGFLDHLGISYMPLGAFDPNLQDHADAAEPQDDIASDHTMSVPKPSLFPAAEENVFEAKTDEGRHTAMARIKAYRGEADFTGIHEYYVVCPHCAAELDFPTGTYVERYLRLRCAACDEVFLGEVLRTNLSLRYYKGWQRRDPE